MTGDAGLARALATDYTGAPLEPADRAMLDYALKLTRDPASMTEADVETLKDAGFSDRAVLDVCQITSYYAYVNRLADGLGVDLEASWTEEEMIVTRAELEEAKARRRATPPREPGDQGPR